MNLNPEFGLLSNGLVANVSKTVFMVLNMTRTECEATVARDIEIGNVTVPRSSSTKLLEVNIDEKQNWKEHFSGTNRLINSLNRRTFSIRRIRNQIPKKELLISE